MIKTILSLFLLSSSIANAGQSGFIGTPLMNEAGLIGKLSPKKAEFTCSSIDFHPDTRIGQSLKLSFDQKGRLISLEKLDGSFLCGGIQIQYPRLLLSSKSSCTYAAHFYCDEWNGRIILPRTLPLTRARYEFSYVDEASQNYRRVSYNLDCRHSSP